MWRPPFGEKSSTKTMPCLVRRFLSRCASASTTLCSAFEVSRSRQSVFTVPSGPWSFTAAGRSGSVRVIFGGVAGRGYWNRGPIHLPRRYVESPAIRGARIHASAGVGPEATLTRACVDDETTCGTMESFLSSVDGYRKVHPLGGCFIKFRSSSAKISDLNYILR